MPRPPASSVVRSARVIGVQFATWRKLLGLTAQQLSERAGISRGTLRRIETGDAGVSFTAVLSVARGLGVLERLTEASDPYQTDLGRMRADQELPKRVRR